MIDANKARSLSLQSVPEHYKKDIELIDQLIESACRDGLCETNAFLKWENAKVLSDLYAMLGFVTEIRYGQMQYSYREVRVSALRTSITGRKTKTKTIKTESGTLLLYWAKQSKLPRVRATSSDDGDLGTGVVAGAILFGG